MSRECTRSMNHIKECSYCLDVIMTAMRRLQASIAGSTKSDKKAKAARRNGRKGGRPRKQ